MIYDQYGRAIDEKAISQRLTQWEAADRWRPEQSNALSPSKLGAIFTRANQGDPTAQAKLAEEILEKNWDIRHAVGTRAAAVAGIRVSCVAADPEDARAVEIAAAAEAMLEAVEPARDRQGDCSFPRLLASMSGALLPGYDCAEIQWAEGGTRIEAFSPLPRDAVTFSMSQQPLIATTATPTGLPLTPNKFIFHRPGGMRGDATRGGLIRPLGWLHLFANLGIKDLARFVEKFGMPFVLAKLDENAWKTERNTIADLIRNFGSDGGAVFSKAVEVEMLDARGMNSSGQIYFRLLEYTGQCVTKVVLGQTATSSDGGGFSADNAQSAVRQDLLESDCADLAATIRADVLRPWTHWNYGPDAPVPMLHFDCQPPADKKQQATIAGDVAQRMGFELDGGWVESTFGVVLAKGPDGKPVRRAPGPDTLALADDQKKKTAGLSSLNSPAPQTMRW